MRRKWTKEKVFTESRKYESELEFQRRKSRAFNVAKENGWLKDMVWLAKSSRKPAGYWKKKDNVISESHNYETIAEFCDKNYLAYKSADDNGWLDEMVWLKKSSRKKKGYWQIKENVFAEANNYKHKSDFQRWSPSAFASAWKNDWLKEMTWFQPKGAERAPKGPVHLVYVYVDEEKKYAYVGATNNMQRRDTEHRRKNDPVCKYFDRVGKNIPTYKILREGLTVIERQREERIQSLYYRDFLHYKLLNNVNLTGENIGSIGSLASKWPKSKVIKEAEKYKTPTEFFTNSAGAYDAALRYHMMNRETFPWFYSKRMPPGWWNIKEHVFDESRRFETWDDFSKNAPAAYSSAKKHKWDGEMNWLKYIQVPQGFWKVEENVIEESRKYKTKTQIFKGCHAAYDYANEHNLWDKMPWIKTSNKARGHWTKERVIKEGKKYKTRMEFRKGSSTAYAKAAKYHWLDEIFPKPAK